MIKLLLSKSWSFVWTIWQSRHYRWILLNPNSILCPFLVYFHSSRHGIWWPHQCLMTIVRSIWQLNKMITNVLWFSKNSNLIDHISAFGRRSSLCAFNDRTDRRECECKIIEKYLKKCFPFLFTCELVRVCVCCTGKHNKNAVMLTSNRVKVFCCFFFLSMNFWSKKCDLCLLCMCVRRYVCSSCVYVFVSFYNGLIVPSSFNSMCQFQWSFTRWTENNKIFEFVFPVIYCLFLFLSLPLLRTRSQSLN